MNRFSLIALTAALACPGCVYPAPPPPQPVLVLSVYDRSFDAALAAAADVGVAVRVSDRTAGRIFGSQGGVEVVVEVTERPDGSVRVAFSPSSSPTEPQLGDKWLAAYHRRMGR